MQGEYIRQIAVCGDNSVRRRFLSYDSCVASSRICQHVVAKEHSLSANVLLEPHRSHMTEAPVVTVFHLPKPNLMRGRIDMHQTPVPCGQDFNTVKMEPLSLFYVRP